MKVEKIKYDEWKRFDESINESTDDLFTIELSDRMGDAFYDFDQVESEGFINKKDALLDGIFVEEKLVGIIDKSDVTLKNGKEACSISFLLIHPKEQGKGIGKAVLHQIIRETNLEYVEMYACTHSAKVLCTKVGFEQDGNLCRSWEYYLYHKGTFQSEEKANDQQ